MQSRHAERWKRHRQGGAIRFVIVWGVLVWGLTTAGLAIVANTLFGTLTFSKALAAIISFSFAGLLWGVVMWQWWERKYGESSGAG